VLSLLSVVCLSKSCKVIETSTNPQRVWDFPLVFHYNRDYLAPFLRYLISNNVNVIPLKYGLQVIQSHWKWHLTDRHILCRLQDRIRYWSKIALVNTPLYITTLSGKTFASRHRTKWLGYNGMQQEAQLPQRDRATLHVIEYFFKSLEVT